jgi:polyhydroxybutyrate depolymerase
LWSPALFRFEWLRFDFLNVQYAGALFSDGVTYALPPGAGVDFFVPARYPRPGDKITLYGVGFGPVHPDRAEPDKTARRHNPVALPVRFFYDHTEASVASAGLDPTLRGFYRFEVIVPDVDSDKRHFERDLIPLTYTLGDVKGSQVLTATESDHNATAESIDVGGVRRTYDLYVPHNFERGKGALVIALHGHGLGGPGTVMQVATGLNDQADREGFAVAYPDGLQGPLDGAPDWAWYFNTFSFPSGAVPDDVAFVRAIIETLEHRIRPDARRIYVTGMSAGALMTHRVGVELSEKVAAIFAVEGTLYEEQGNSVPSPLPNAAAPVSVLIFHGDQDPNVPYCGVEVPPFFFAASADQVFNYWAGLQANNCSQVDTVAPLCLSVGMLDAQGNFISGQPGTISQKAATGCRSNAEVRFYRLVGGAHHWYHAPLNVPGRIPSNPAFNRHTGVTTNEIMWKFFLEHPKQ